MDQQLPPLGQILLGAFIEMDTLNTGTVPSINPRTATGQQAHDYLLERTTRIWPALAHPTH
ncbi:hypothetical protein ACIBL3_43910 [Kribbella sp. NPDC050124]|uniref:hypothetical protein n=1 Tax=Kribbella sp. NPDC050124 TaxID=3364114 RepID=UPI0037957F0B